MSNLTLGSDVMVSSSVALIGDDHPFDDPTRTIHQHSRNPYASVIIEGDNLIGFGTLIVGDVRIARGAIVGAGSLVTTDLDEAAVYAGRPVRRLRGRYE
jgi:acetyltransferase-like isoleucine patch superfamily enzyme